MSNGYILFYDSGIGGLTTLNSTKKLLQNEKFLYFADDKNCPYGNRDPEEIEELVIKNLKELLKRYDIKMVVFACNTITTCCVEHLRVLYNLLFVGTEPAILPAMRNSKDKEVLCIATKATFKQNKYKRLIEKVQGKVYSFGLSTLAGQIEEKLLEDSQIDVGFYIWRIKRVLKAYPGVDALVLGCTHYCFYKSEFEKRLKLKVYDGNDGVARRVKQLLEREGRLAEDEGKTEILLSSGDEKKAQRYLELLKKL